MGRILLVPSPSVGRDGALRPYLPWGLLSLRALSGPGRPDVELWLPSEGFDDAAQLGVSSSAALAERLVDALPDLDEVDAVGLSTMCGSFHHSLQVARRLKARSPDLAVWMGGPQASMVAAELLEAVAEVDAIFLGEGEATFAEVLDRWASGERDLSEVAGVRTRHGLTPRAPIGDLDELPEVSLTAEDLAVLRRQRRGEEAGAAIPLEVARGCPNRCAFCSTRHHWGRRVRRKSEGRVIAEMRARAAETGLRRFELLGDNVTASLPRLRRLCRALLRDARDLEPRWMCDATLDRLLPQDLRLLWDAGCRGFFVGVESGSQVTLDRLRKGVDLERELEVIDCALDMGFDIKASLIVGFPWEKDEEVERTFALHGDLLRRGVRECQLWLLCPLPGTELTEAHAVTFDRFGSRIAMDGLRLDEETRALVRDHPALFSQLGRFECAVDPVVLSATVETAFQVNLLHRRGRSSEKQVS